MTTLFIFKIRAIVANILAAYILGYIIFNLGLYFTRNVVIGSPLEEEEYYGNSQKCRYIGDCYIIVRRYAFLHSQACLITGSIILASFTLWAHAQAVVAFNLQGLMRRGWASTPVSRHAMTLFARRRALGDEKGGHEERSDRRHQSTIFLMSVTILSSVSAMALFAPTKTTLEASGPLWSYPTESYKHGNLSDLAPKHETLDSLAQFYIESVATARRAVDAAWRQKSSYTHGVAHQDYEYTPTVRIGDSIYRGVRTGGIGANLASFNEWFMSQRGRNASMNFSGPQRRGWNVAPDFQMNELVILAHGTDVQVKCDDISGEYTARIKSCVAPHCPSDYTVNIHLDGSVSSSSREALASPIHISTVFGKPEMRYENIILHQPEETWRVTPLYFPVLDKNGAVAHRIAITQVPYGGVSYTRANLTVLSCSYSGTSTLRRVSVHSSKDFLETDGDIGRTDPLDRETLIETMETVEKIVKFGADRLAEVLKHRTHADEPIPDCTVPLFEGVLTDLAQAYWSLVRQRAETARDQINLDSSALNGTREGILRGSYTRLGGATWGLVFPMFMFAMPIFTLLFWICQTMYTSYSKKKEEVEVVKKLLEDEDLESSDEDEAAFIPSLNHDH